MAHIRIASIPYYIKAEKPRLLNQHWHSGIAVNILNVIPQSPASLNRDKFQCFLTTFAYNQNFPSMLPLIETWLINATIGQSVVRNQGAGIANGIRYELDKHFIYKEFFCALQDKRGPGVYADFLDALTKKLENKTARDKNNQPGQDQIKWGSARKCINLVARSTVYNIYICKHYGINVNRLVDEAYMARLELPLDSFAIAGLRDDYCKLSKADQAQIDPSIFRQFTIVGLTPEKSAHLQKLAQTIAESDIRPLTSGCRVHLDIMYWRDKKKGSK